MTANHTPEQTRALLALHSPESGAAMLPPRVHELRTHLTALGVSVDVSTADQPDPTGYDVVHVFNVWEPVPALTLLRHLRQFSVPIVLSPSYIELSEFAWAARALPQVFAPTVTAEDRGRYLRAAVDGSLVADDVARFARNEIIPGYFAALTEMVAIATHLIAYSELEMAQLWAAGIPQAPFTIAHDGVDAARFAAASPHAFAARHGLDAYVLSVGPIEPRRNQLLLAYALRDAGVPLVLLGPIADAAYADLLKRHAGANLVIDDVTPSPEQLAAAYAGARVVALPSWCEGGPLAALEAGAAGSALVLSDRSCAKEYLSALATYCDPGDPTAIRTAVTRAFHESPDAPHRRALRARAASYSWEETARATLAGYRRAHLRPRRTVEPAITGRAVQPAATGPYSAAPAMHPASAGPVPTAPRKLEIGSGTDPQPGYEHLDARQDLPDLDHVHDIQQPLPFPDVTFDEILSRSCLEHVSWRDVRRILTDWCRVLKPGGTLRVYIPDFEYLCRMYLSGAADEHLHPSYIDAANELLGGYTPNAWAMIKMFGGQEYPANFHCGGYDLATFTRILHTAGFEQVTRVPPHHGLYVVARRAEATSTLGAAS